VSVYKVVAGVSSIRTDEEAQKVGEELERRFGDRPIVASEVVQLARRPRSPLHRHFEWDDGVAAEAYREVQARTLLRSIAVVRSDLKAGRTRAYQNVTVLTDSGARKVYLAERIVWATPELADQVVVRAERELLGWRAKYGDYQELRAAGALVDEAITILEAGGV
jgi:hypothetical protein